MSAPHASVLLHEMLKSFAGRKIRYFVDATLGAGGHSAAFLEAHPEIELLVGIDQDPVARNIAAGRLAPWKHKVKIVHGNFLDIAALSKGAGIEAADGIIFDLGVSSMQFDMSEKGFSFMRDGPLDMRMDPTQELTAAEIVNTWQEGDIGRVIRDYGEEKRWRSAARAIVEARKVKPLSTTLELAAVVKKAIPVTKKGIHPATLVFQALRIAVNRELEVLENGLPAALNLLSPGGRLAVISFHSLEDRIVKNFMRYAADDKVDTQGIGGVFLDKEPTVIPITRKPVAPADNEIAANPRSRSAKLRVVEKK